MSRLVWDDPGKRSYEIGVDRGVLYPASGYGVPWNGLIAIQEAPSGGDILEGRQDGQKIWNSRRGEGFSATISAYTYPREFELYDGTVQNLTGQPRDYFSFSYRTRLANDLESDAGSLIHLVYNAIASPTARPYSSLGDTVDPTAFSWAIQTVPVILPEGQITSHLVINTKIAHSWAVTALEDIIYGSMESDPLLPSIPEVLDIFEDASILKITDHGDGTWTAEGPDEAFHMILPTMFEITWPSAVYIDSDTYRISSL